jgi:hypothetical protein
MKTDKENKDQPTPITDGDSRPDKQHRRTKSSSPAGSPKKEKKFSKERGADINSADDFRDAK